MYIIIIQCQCVVRVLIVLSYFGLSECKIEPVVDCHLPWTLCDIIVTQCHYHGKIHSALCSKHCHYRGFANFDKCSKSGQMCWYWELLANLNRWSWSWKWMINHWKCKLTSIFSKALFYQGQKSQEMVTWWDDGKMGGRNVLKAGKTHQ